MKTYIIIIFAGLLFGLSVAAQEKLADNKLKLLAADSINGSEITDLSGLAYCADNLVAVSDKHDNLIYKIDIGKAKASPFINLLSIPAKPLPQKSVLFKAKKWLSRVLFDALYDWEGISCDLQGNFYLLSETFIDVLKVNSTGETEWMNLQAYDSGYKAGFFQKANFVEGLVWNNGQFIIAIERDPRGILTAKQNKNKLWQLKYHTINDSLIAPQLGRQSDFTGMAVYQNMLFTLERNASAVCRRDILSLAVENCWSYAHIEHSDKYRYSDNRYGLAEGIAVKEGKLYLLFDNNGDTRLNNSEDTRPQLFTFGLPIFLD